MDKEHFLIDLKLHLRQLPLNEQQAILSEYETLFEEKEAAGLSEYEITRELPTPKAIAMTILDELNIPFEKQSQPSNDWMEFSYTNKDYQDDQSYDKSYQSDSTFIRLSQILGVAILNLFFMIWAILAIFVLILCGWAVTLSFLVSPLVSIYFLLTSMSVYAWFQLFVTLILLGVGILGGLILKPVSKGALKVFVIYTKWNIHVLKGGRI